MLQFEYNFYAYPDIYFNNLRIGASYNIAPGEQSFILIKNFSFNGTVDMPHFEGAGEAIDAGVSNGVVSVRSTIGPLSNIGWSLFYGFNSFLKGV